MSASAPLGFTWAPNVCRIMTVDYIQFFFVLGGRGGGGSHLCTQFWGPGRVSWVEGLGLVVDIGFKLSKWLEFTGFRVIRV